MSHHVVTISSIPLHSYRDTHTSTHLDFSLIRAGLLQENCNWDCMSGEHCSGLNSIMCLKTSELGVSLLFSFLFFFLSLGLQRLVSCVHQSGFYTCPVSWCTSESAWGRNQPTHLRVWSDLVGLVEVTSKVYWAQGIYMMVQMQYLMNSSGSKWYFSSVPPYPRRVSSLSIDPVSRENSCQWL